jgi:hypothetical protein
MVVTPLAVGDITYKRVLAELELSGRLRDDHRELPDRLWFLLHRSAADVIPAADADPVVAALALPAMAAGRPLQVEAPGSCTLLEGPGRIMRQTGACLKEVDRRWLGGAARGLMEASRRRAWRRHRNPSPRERSP